MYGDALSNKYKRLRDNNQIRVVYRWVSKINRKCYAGSSVKLNSWLRNHFSLTYLAKRTLKYKIKIYNALLAHGNENLQLKILLICAVFRVKRKRFNIDYFKPGYNILATAGSSLQFKHPEETLFKFKSHKLSDKALYNFTFIFFFL